MAFHLGGVLGIVLALAIVAVWLRSHLRHDWITLRFDRQYWVVHAQAGVVEINGFDTSGSVSSMELRHRAVAARSGWPDHILPALITGKGSTYIVLPLWLPLLMMLLLWGVMAMRRKMPRGFPVTCVSGNTPPSHPGSPP